jgi:copper chaperone
VLGDTLAGYLNTHERTTLSGRVTYTVPAIHCGHCAAAIKDEISIVEGVGVVDVDLDSKAVTIHGEGLSDDALRAAIHEAGYEAD